MGIFDPNNGLFRTISRAVDMIGLSMLWFFLCLPVVTIAPATAALYRTVVAVYYEKSEEVFLRYFRSFKENLKVGIPTSILFAVCALILLLGVSIMSANLGGTVATVVFTVYCIALLLPLGTACYLFPLLGRFTFTVKELFVTAMQMALAHLPTTILVLVITAVGIVLSLMRIWMLFFMPVILTLIVSYFLEKVFRKHMTNEEI